MSGKMILTKWTDFQSDAMRLRIDRADPEIRVSPRVLADIEALGWASEGVFAIPAENGTARYALREYDPVERVWTARRIGPDPTA